MTLMQDPVATATDLNRTINDAELGESEVVILRWPEDAARREQLRTQGVPRLLLADPDQSLPLADDPLEDWMLASGDDVERDRRVSALARVAGRSSADVEPPTVDACDLLRYKGRWVALAPSEAILMRALLRHIDNCTPLDELLADGAGRSSLRGRVKRLRERTESLGLSITTVRGRGVALSLVD